MSINVSSPHQFEDLCQEMLQAMDKARVLINLQADMPTRITKTNIHLLKEYNRLSLKFCKVKEGTKL